MRTSTLNVTYGEITVLLNVHNVYVIRNLPEAVISLENTQIRRYA